MKKVLLSITVIIIALTMLLSLTACGEEKPNEDAPNPNEWNITDTTIADKDKVRVVINLSIGEVKKHINLELYPTIAPLSVANFLQYVDEDYYDNVVFHRVIEGFMIQTGGYYVIGREIYIKEGQHDPIKGEFSDNGVENPISHKAGVISFARTSVMDSATSQFFICSADASDSLDGKYAAFGRVCDQQSLDVVVEISKLPTKFVNMLFQNFPGETVVTILSIDRYTGAVNG